MDCKLRLVAVFDGRSGSCEAVADSCMAGSFLGRPWSPSPWLMAFRFKLAIPGRGEDEEGPEGVGENID